MWNLLPPQLTSRLLDSRRSQWIVRPRVTRTSPILTWLPPPVNRPSSTFPHSGTVRSTQSRMLPPGSPLPQVPTAYAAISMTSPADFPVTGNEPENE